MCEGIRRRKKRKLLQKRGNVEGERGEVKGREGRKK